MFKNNVENPFENDKKVVKEWASAIMKQKAKIDYIREVNEELQSRNDGEEQYDEYNHYTFA